MKRQIRIVAALAMVTAVACSKDGGDGAKKDKDPAAEFKFESVQGEIAEIKAALAAGEDAKYKCAAGLSYAEGFSESGDEATKKAGLEITRLCGYDVPMLAASQEVDKAEAARKAAPDEEVLSDCYSAAWDMAKEELEVTYKDDAKFAELSKRWGVVCPPN